VTIPALSCVELTRRAARYLQVVNLPDRLDNADSVASVLYFVDGAGHDFTIGEPTSPLRLPVAVPDRAVTRSS
jgi:hypothetical protein